MTEMNAPYIELHCHSYYSLLDGSSAPEDLVERALQMGYPALALTDHDGLYGAVRFWRAARERGLKPIVGAEVTLESGSHLTLLAETQAGYANLCRLISAGQLAGQKAQPKLTLETVAAHAKGLLCLSGCRRGPVASAILSKDPDRAREAAGDLYEIFGDRLWHEVQRHMHFQDLALNAELVALARWLGVEVVATNNVHFARPAGQALHDVLTCIRHRTTLHEALASGLLHTNSEQALLSPQEMCARFADLPQALSNTVRIAERCNVSLDFSAQRLPAFSIPSGHSASSYLEQLCTQGLKEKFGGDDDKAKAQLAHELGVIDRTGLSGYFLVVWDIVRYARGQGIRCQGRGSAANSLVAYLLGITPVDPLQHNLLFERFLSEHSQTMPDIDVDFAANRREEVIQYVYERYGPDHVAMVCNVVTYRARSALREAAKALAFPPETIDRMIKTLDTRTTAGAAETIEDLFQTEESADETQGLPWQVLADIVRQMEGLPRHLSIHVGGMLITAAPLVEVVPLERATMPDRVVVQWNKDSVEDAGLIKFDLLGLRTLGAIDEALTLIRDEWHVDLDLDRLPLDDPALYEMLQRADTIGCFQVESRAQAQMLPRLRPTCFEDLIVEIALVRPGPIAGNMVHPYLNRRHGKEPVRYLHPALEQVLSETLGVMIFQEQVIRVAQAIAGFSPGEADQLRRSMSRSRSAEAMAALHDRFLSGACAHGVDEETAEQIFHQLSAFSGYGFCKSHAAAFALVTYQTLYLKAYYPEAFTCALLNHQPMGFYSPDVLIGDARRHGIAVLRPDVNHSQAKCTLERPNSDNCHSRRFLAGIHTQAPGSPPTARGDDRSADQPTGSATVLQKKAIRLGLCYVHGMGEEWQDRIVERRGTRPFSSLRNLCVRTGLPRSLVENMIRSGTLDSLGQKRRKLLWELGALDYRENELDLEIPVLQVKLPTLERLERLGWEYELLGLSPDDHLMDIYGEQLREQGVIRSDELTSFGNGRTVLVAGVVITRQRPPSAKGTVFFTLEDQAGLINLVISPEVYRQYKSVLRGSPLLVIEGRVQHADGTTNVLVRHAAGMRSHPAP